MFSEIISSDCGTAQNRWDDAIGYAWSLSTLSLVILAATSVVIQRPDGEGKWPTKILPVNDLKSIEDEEKVPRSRHN